MFSTLISTTELAGHLDDPNWVILDCRFSLQDFEKGRRDYLDGHIPNAKNVHLNEELSGKIIPGVNGRHPLPEVDKAVRLFSQLGIGEGVQVVVYDDAGGALAAVRAWWMLRWLGHEAVAVLDGGWQKWQADGGPVQSGNVTRLQANFLPKVDQRKFVTLSEVERFLADPTYRVCDARAAERYRGENETVDPVAGHIPGAISAPYFANLNPDLTFRSPEGLRQHYQAVLGDIPPERVIFYCGSGVTSIHNILAMLHAGLGEARLYVGSWSEWITDPRRPIAK